MMKTRLTFKLCFLVCLLRPLYAHADSKSVFVSYQMVKTQIHEQSYVFYPDKISVTRNSNRLDPIQSVTRLGHFELKKNEASDFYASLVKWLEPIKKSQEFRDKLIRKISGANQELSEMLDVRSKPGFRGIRILLNGAEYLLTDSQVEWLDEKTEEVWVNPKLASMDAVEVRLLNSGELRITYIKSNVISRIDTVSKEKQGCVQGSLVGTWDCTIQNYGYVTLRPPAVAQ